QVDHIAKGFQMIMSDRLYAFVNDSDSGAWGTPVGYLPTDPTRAFFDPAAVTHQPSTLDASALIEPGSRLYMHTSRAQPANGGAPLTHPPTTGSAGARGEPRAPPPRLPPDALPPPAVRGAGCLFALTADGKNGLSVCREVLNTVPSLPYYV